MNSTLSVIVPSRTMSNLIPCVQAVTHLDECDVIVVWDRSRGNDWAPPSAAYRVREVEQEFIYARNCNTGIISAGDNDVILLNDDALLETAGGFSALQAWAKQCPEFGIIGAVTNVTGQPLQRPLGHYCPGGPREVPHAAPSMPLGCSMSVTAWTMASRTATTARWSGARG